MCVCAEYVCDVCVCAKYIRVFDWSNRDNIYIYVCIP